jgi:hypothetical protein
MAEGKTAWRRQTMIADKYPEVSAEQQAILKVAERQLGKE